MKNWGQYKPLSTEELQQTAIAAQQGDSKAIERLVTANIKLASKIANKYSDFAGTQVDDLTSEALLGLLEAIPAFDAKKGVKFTSYATWYMRMRVLNFLMENYRLIKIGTTQAQKKIFWRLNREVKALKKEGVEATPENLAEKIGVRQKDVTEMQIRMGQSEAPLSATNPSDPQGMTMEDTLASTTVDPETYTTKRRMAAWTRDRMIEFEQRLNTKEQAIWNHRIAAQEPLTLDETGTRAGCSRQYVNQTERRLHKAFVKYARNKAR